jgi:outer membrane immunogenic protein
MKKLLLASLAGFALLGIGTANAADLGVRPAYKAPPPVAPPVQDWSGVYVGLEGGYGWGRHSVDTSDFGDFLIRNP